MWFKPEKKEERAMLLPKAIATPIQYFARFIRPKKPKHNLTKFTGPSVLAHDLVGRRLAIYC